jgi:hypothetical protein
MLPSPRKMLEPDKTEVESPKAEKSGEELCIREILRL